MGASDSMDKIPAEYDEGTKTALICEDNPEFIKNIISALQELRYAAETAGSANDALEKLRFNRYDVVLLSERFGGSPPDGNEVLKYLRYMPMATRRHIFLALLGQNLTTEDNMTAFDKSVNAVINEKDIPNLKGILNRTITDNERFYKVYKESLIKMGKR